MTRDVDITGASGLPVRLDLGTGALIFGSGVTSDTPAARRLDDLRSVLREPSSSGPEVVSRLYRAVHTTDDAGRLARAGLRYDLTVTLPGTFGREYLKTTGHYHSRDGDGVSFPEVYEVCHGRAAFVLQRVDDIEAESPRVEQVWVQICAAGDRIVIPPGFGHVTVNIGMVPLVVSDLVSLRSSQLYGSFRALRGAACYVLEDPGPEDGFCLEQNGSYGAPPVPVVTSGSRWAPWVEHRGPIYRHFRSHPHELEFLERPAGFREMFEGLWQARSDHDQRLE